MVTKAMATLRGANKSLIPTIPFLNISVQNVSMQEFLENLHEGVVFTTNIDHLVKLQYDQEFARIYNLAEYRLCDSQILFWLSRWLNTPLKEKISGSDLFPQFCQFSKHNPNIRIFLLGGLHEVATRATERINAKVGRQIVVDSYSPSYGFERDEAECSYIVERIQQSGATVVAIGVGAPKQEKWIFHYKDRLPSVKIFMAVGATLDFEAGALKRAPKWMSRCGLEWLYRLLSEPQRLWKRYLIDPLPIFWLLFQQKLGCYTPPVFQASRRILKQSKLTRKHSEAKEV